MYFFSVASSVMDDNIDIIYYIYRQPFIYYGLHCCGLDPKQQVKNKVRSRPLPHLLPLTITLWSQVFKLVSLDVPFTAAEQQI